MVVAQQRQDAAIGVAAGQIAVAEDVAGAVDARPLAVPDGEDPVDAPFAAHRRLLRAPDRRGGEVLVEARLEAYVGGLQFLGGAHELQVHPAERGAAIARDEPSRALSGAAVALPLHQAQANQGLRSGKVDMILAEVVLVAKRHLGQYKACLHRDAHAVSPARPPQRAAVT